MKKNKQKADTKQNSVPQFGRLTLLVGALIATGVLPPLSLPEAMAAPLPVPCGGCGNGAPANTVFLQQGQVTTNLDPLTGLPVANGKNLDIYQKSQVAILNWQSFNIDKGYSVYFHQPNATASALNKIWDSGPSHISGSLTADGQIYLINHNGVVFHNGAQVNTNTLIASSLDISDSLFTAGYITNPNANFSPAFSGTGGFVKVETGAVLNGSRIMLFAPVVENNGTINTPDGQTVLAAGHNVYLEASQDPNLRGVLVEVDVHNPGVADTLLAGQGLQHTEAGVATNAGDIVAQRGNITLVGFAVNQQGRVSATTSVTENGSIKLLARYNTSNQINDTLTAKYNTTGTYDIRATQTGKVTLGSGSVTQVVPELADSSTTTDGQGFKQSIVEVMGKTIEMQSGSKIIVPGGKVTLAAMGSIAPATGGVYQQIVDSIAYSSFLNPNYKPVADSSGARVFLDSGSSIDVSGSDASVSVARNILTVQLRGTQLADAPVQRNGYLWGKNVLIDIRQGSTLVNYSSDEALIGRTVVERTSAGGSVNLISTGDVVMKSGAKVDLSGGQINYTGANINTTSLISNGVAYDIATASPDRIYNGISGTYSVTHNKWGITENYSTLAGGDIRGRWDPGYVEGKSAGTLTVLAPNAVLNGDIVAKTVAGTYQRNAFVASGSATVPYKDTWQMLPQGGTLVIGDSAPVKDVNTNAYDFINDSNVTIQTGAAQLASDFALFDQAGSVTALPANFQKDIFLDTNLFSSATGLNRLEVYSNNAVTVASGTAVKLVAGGAITLKGHTVDMKGSIDAPAGTVVLDTTKLTKGQTVLGAVNVTGSTISTRGQWVNDALQAGIPDLSKPLLYNGGNITLQSGADLTVTAGTLLDASGGAWLDAGNKLHGGNGGAISLASGMNGSTSFKAQLDGVNLRAYSTAGGKGGTLNINVGDIYLGGATSVSPGALVLSPEFFQSGGFSSYNLTGINGVTVTLGTVIEPKVQSLIPDRTAAKQASGADVNTFTKVGLLPDWQRAPANIKLSGGTLLVDKGAVVRVEPAANIELTATNQLTVLGTLDAAAGSINLNLKSTDAAYSSYSGNQSIWLGSDSKLLSQGYFQKAQPNAQNLTQGQVLAGGKINISTDIGFVVVQKGSLMDVSGTSANIDLPQLVSGTLAYRTTHVTGDAGKVAIQTKVGGFLDGNMNAGVEAGSQASAGSFSLTLNNNPGFSSITATGYPQKPAQIQVSQGGNGNFAAQAGLVPGSDAGAGQTKLNTAIESKFLLDASALKKSGFDQVTLKSDQSIVLADQVNLQTRRSITLDAPEIALNGSSTMSSATVSSAHVTLGNLDKVNQIPVVAVNPVAGLGTLNVEAQLVDLTGNFVVSGINQFNVVSRGNVVSSDIRLNGVIDSTGKALTGSVQSQGDVSLTADQVYPTTMSQFTISRVDGAGNPAGTITVLPGEHSANPSPVMSAGGMLKLSADVIEQDGVLKAPMGTLDLNATSRVTLGSGSTTSVSADGLIIPFGLIQGGNAWMYDLTGNGDLVSISDNPQQIAKIVKLTAPNIDLKGSTTLANGKVLSAALVNLSGGGDLYANEFFAGSGGTVNVLDPSKAPANTFAIIPGLSGFAPYDPQAFGQYAQTGSKTTLQAGASVYLAGGNGLAAGYYTLLPASYALLAGAYRVTAVSGYSDLQPGQGASTQLNGSQIMAGKFAVVGTNIQDARYSGFSVTPGAIVRTQSEYHDSYANSFFAAQAATNGSITPRSPIDAGQFIVDATGTTLVLAGTFNTQHAAGGKGAWVDLNSASGFDIVNAAGSGTAGGVELTTSVLNALGAENLLIGGKRAQTSNGMSITVGASSVTVENSGATLSGPEIILVANNAVTVKAGQAGKPGSNIAATGTYSGTPEDIAISGDGALLRVSSAAQVTVARSNVTGTQGTLTVENGASATNSPSLTANSILLDATQATKIGDSATLKGKAFSVAASAIDIGSGTSGANSLALTPALLAQMQNFQDITLHSYNNINFYGAAALGGVDASTGNHLISNLTLNAGYLNGINNAGSTNIIDAANVTLMNNNSGTSAPIAYGGGNLTINADQITLAAGDKSIQGFNTVTMAAAKQIVGQGTGSITVSTGDASANDKLVLQAGQITGTNKSNQTITAATKATATTAAIYKAIEINPVAGATVSANEALNARLAIVGKNISDTGVINLSGGSVTLHAAGAAATDGVTLGSGSSTIASGVSKTIAGQTVYAQAGTVSLIADNGGVDIQSGSVVDVSGAAGGGDAGNINIAATNGAVAVAGNLKGAANSSYAQGSFTLDAKSLALNANSLTGNALTDLNDTLTAGSFTTLRDMRIRTGDQVIAADATGSVRAKAQTFKLTADTGKIDVFGTVDSTGTGGGNILLAANNNLTLNAGALLDAHATGAGQAGGKVTLATTVGTIELNNQRIDVHGSGNTGGSVLLRAPQIAVYGSTTNNEVALYNNDLTTGLAAAKLNVSTGANVTVEAFDTYKYVGDTSLTSTTGLYQADAAAFTANYANAIKARLGMLGDSNLHLTPGVEIDSTGNLTLAADWDLSLWRFNNGNGIGTAFNTEAGILTLRAGGNLVLNSSLSDGFTSANTPISGPSWSYRLLAGADTTSTDVMAVKATGSANGSVLLAAGSELTKLGVTTYTMKQVRTGTGFIDIAAGGNVALGNRDSVIYTAGQAETSVPAAFTNNGKNYYGTNGGDVSITAKGDVIGAATDQLITDWQWRPVNVLNYKGVIQPAWWTNIGSFRQNIGTLGGGNVSVTAGGNINDLSVVAPTTGYVDSNGTHVLGGGNLGVSAGGNINSGVFYVGKGQGSIRAGGDLGASRYNGNDPLYTVLALGQGNFDVRTGGDLNLETVLNPTALTQGYSQVAKSAAKTKTYFFTYGDTSGVSLSSLSGNVALINNVSTINSFFNLNTTNGGTSASTVYPGTLLATALGGSILSYNTLTLFPSNNGNLKFIAANDIQVTGQPGTIGTIGQIIMSDAASSGMQADSPKTTGISLLSALSSGHSSIHALDTQPVIIAAGDSIVGDNTLSQKDFNIVVPKSVQVQAGQDVRNLSLSVQNLNSTDTSSVVAGRDIAFTPNELNLANTTSGITVAGPGQIVLQAGRNVDLGQSAGVTTTGNLTNSLLPEQGASVTVLAGVGQGATATQAFIDKYIDPAASAAFGTDLITYVGKYGAPQNQTTAQAFTTFSALSKPLQNAFVRQVFFSELKQAGRNAVNTGNYKSGYDAIATLFPSTGYKGDINLYYSQIKTGRGGDINLLTPGGGVNAGLANASSSGPVKTAAELGIVTVKGGDVNAFVNNDFTVNQSRVFTLQGGNILMWSSYGNIDAGKGSKTASSTPAPLLVVDPKTGTFTLDVTQSVVGSGIRVLLANKNVVPGSVDLYAPAGEINAGDAGIGAAGNIFLGALVVRGADNINFGGTSAGVPVAAPAPVSVGMNLQDASKAADQATQSIASMNGVDTNDFKPTFLSIEVIGLGDQNCGDDDQSAGCKKGRQSSDTDL